MALASGELHRNFPTTRHRFVRLIGELPWRLEVRVPHHQSIASVESAAVGHYRKNTIECREKRNNEVKLQQALSNTYISARY